MELGSGDVALQIGLVYGRALANELHHADQMSPVGRPVQGHLAPRVGALHPSAPKQQLADHSQLTVSSGPVQRRAVSVLLIYIYLQG